MTFTKECVAGYGHTSSLWFWFADDKLNGYAIETPSASETNTIDGWIDQHLLVIKKHHSHIQRDVGVLPCLTISAGTRAVQAIRDYNMYELALAFTAHYSWQLINGAKILPSYTELAKVYAGIYAMYLFKTPAELEKTAKQLELT